MIKKSRLVKVSREYRWDINRKDVVIHLHMKNIVGVSATK